MLDLGEPTLLSSLFQYTSITSFPFLFLATHISSPTRIDTQIPIAVSLMTHSIVLPNPNTPLT